MKRQLKMHNWILLDFIGEANETAGSHSQLRSRKTQVVFHQAVDFWPLHKQQKDWQCLIFCVACQLARLSYLAYQHLQIWN
jgi:hypothetical protein